jgi:hypothetical protein
MAAQPLKIAHHHYPSSSMLITHTTHAGISADDIAEHFDRALRNITGAPMPDETDTWVFSPGFENAP